MKTTSCALSIFTAIMLMSHSILLAQSNSTLPTVTVTATDAVAAEAGPDTGTFLVRRSGPTNNTLHVFYRTSGTASNGVDFQALSNSVAIVAGALSATIMVAPIDDALMEGDETAVVRLIPPLTMNPPVGQDYRVGWPSNAVVTIADNDSTETNRPPLVSILSPTNGAMFSAPADIWIFADARDSDGFVDTVEFFEGTNSLGIVTNNPYSMSPVNPFHVYWTNVPPGHYTLTAVATDSSGASSRSDSVGIQVAGTNQGPFVRLNAPQEGDLFSAPADIVLRAYAQDDGDGYDLKVEFFEGTHSLGLGTFVPTLCPAPYCPFYALTWSNVPPGDYVLTAVATDSNGASSRSDPVHIRVAGANEPPTVNIVASDPDAAEPDDDPRMERPTILNLGIFTVTRSSHTNIDLPVYYRLTGSASNGVDFAELSGQATIPAGSWSARIEVDPIDDMLVEGTETVIATVEPPVCIAIYPPPPECYRVGPTNRATVFIRDNDSNKPSNHPPVVRITAPTDGAAFRAGSDITIDAVTTDLDGYAPRVEFFANDSKIGEQEIVFIQAPPPGEPIYFSFVWSNVVAGNYALTAKATDNQGMMSVSGPVHISVAATNPPPTNVPPVVTIRAPDPYAWEGVRGTNTPSNTPGTNTALFAIHRSGGTNSDLTVFYAITGSASNGVDYLRISDRVTIAAGHRVARLTITPIDDALAEKDETVILTLRLPASGASNSAPPYIIGRPHRAAAVIADDDRPRPVCRRLSDGVFHLCLPETSGHCFSIHASADFVNWIALCTNVVSDSALHYVDPDAVELPQRFYRVAPEAQPASEE